MSQKSDVPQTPHYVIIVFSSIYIQGDERSKTCPGHGYPASNQPTAEYISYGNDVESWKKEIQRKTEYGDENFVAFKANPASITREVKINVKDSDDVEYDEYDNDEYKQSGRG